MKKVLLVGIFFCASIAMNAKIVETSQMDWATSDIGLTCNDVAADYAERIHKKTGDTKLAGRAYTAALKLCNAVNGIE